MRLLSALKHFGMLVASAVLLAGAVYAQSGALAEGFNTVPVQAPHLSVQLVSDEQPENNDRAQETDNEPQLYNSVAH